MDDVCMLFLEWIFQLNSIKEERHEHVKSNVLGQCIVDNLVNVDSKRLANVHLAYRPYVGQTCCSTCTLVLCWPNMFIV